uniref:Profilin n=1 Tax=Lotharella oceanica TaxID=641309 RepID=A0A7S2U0M1_9EUKA|mmetsp:Transcript_36663/g.67724  ORF Transcript_36663/g.67724 Transcript_36663/m.67724 type:complete len:115 (+) Transcript_36663:84-428(+)|eukprot:CAMPEP_0170176474 /NCGR_PEP_ID=MMETSP0040_2-20121228/9347_1 /TAXON_ID=641309 /ORGANISM="Lotharella oceanica, Strain CCMP622" /LENGTH=114 /DNA_ID=CAMNT_0010418809 /DNA_START=97 /DNA_END=441 /DNA_ORIENTATION=-
MSWAAYCNLPSATSACIAGMDGTAWGVKGDWKMSKEEGAKIAKPSMGSMLSVGGVKYMIVNKSGDVFFGVKGDYALVVLALTKCYLAAIGPKGKQGALIDEIGKFAASLKQGGY